MQRFLLDTHVLLWWLTDDPRLGPQCKASIRNPNNPVFVSAASTWEMAINTALGKLRAPEDMDAIVEEEGFDKLPITLYHGQAAGNLPALHRDPFDRMLIAQAQAEGLIVFTADAKIPQYNVRTRDPSR